MLSLAADGLADKQIAGRLGIAPSTVKHHLYDTYSGLGVHTRGQVVAWLHAVEAGRPKKRDRVSTPKDRSASVEERPAPRKKV